MRLYGYKRCGTCRKAEKFLVENGIKYKFIDITTTPPLVDELSKIIEKSGKPLKNFFNTSGVVYREDKIKDKLPTLSKLEQIELLASNGKLIKRPLVFDGSRSSVGFKEDEFRGVWL